MTNAQRNKFWLESANGYKHLVLVETNSGKACFYFNFIHKYSPHLLTTMILQKRNKMKTKLFYNNYFYYFLYAQQWNNNAIQKHPPPKQL